MSLSYEQFRALGFLSKIRKQLTLRPGHVQTASNWNRNLYLAVKTKTPFPRAVRISDSRQLVKALEYFGAGNLDISKSGEIRVGDLTFMESETHFGFSPFGEDPIEDFREVLGVDEENIVASFPIKNTFLSEIIRAKRVGRLKNSFYALVDIAGDIALLRRSEPEGANKYTGYMLAKYLVGKTNRELRLQVPLDCFHLLPTLNYQAYIWENENPTIEGDISTNLTLLSEDGTVKACMTVSDQKKRATDKEEFEKKLNLRH